MYIRESVRTKYEEKSRVSAVHNLEVLELHKISLITSPMKREYKIFYLYYTSIYMFLLADSYHLVDIGLHADPLCLQRRGEVPLAQPSLPLLVHKKKETNHMFAAIVF